MMYFVFKMVYFVFKMMNRQAKTEGDPYTPFLLRTYPNPDAAGAGSETTSNPHHYVISVGISEDRLLVVAGSDCEVWQAGRAFLHLNEDSSVENEDFSKILILKMVVIVGATSAAPSFFEPFTIGERQYCDGGLLENNPVMLAMAEAQDLYPDRKVGLIVSLGCGITKRESAKYDSWAGGATRELLEDGRRVLTSTQAVSRSSSLSSVLRSTA